MTRRFIPFIALALVASPVLAGTTVIQPDQVRTHASNSAAEIGNTIVTGPYDPPTADPLLGGTCPLLGTPVGDGNIIDQVFELIAEYTPENGGPDTNAPGDGAVGYANFGRNPNPLDFLICENPSESVGLTSLDETIARDLVSVFRFKLPAAASTGHGHGNGSDSAVTGAYLEIDPALAGFTGLAPAHWPTLSVSLCEPPAKNAWDIGGAVVFDSETDPAAAHPLDPNPVDNDCIVTNRDYNLTNSNAEGGLGQFDVLLRESKDNPDAGYAGGIDNMTWFLKLTAIGQPATIKIPLNQKALDVINAGGTPAGYLELIVRMPDNRGSDSEGPDRTRTGLGLPDGANMLIIEDDNGCYYGGANNCDPLASASTRLVLTN